MRPLIVALLALATGCASADINKAVRNAQYSGRLSSITVQVGGVGVDPEDEDHDSLMQAICAELARRKVHCKGFIVRSEADIVAATNQATASRSDGMLSLRPVHLSTIQFGMNAGMDYNATLTAFPDASMVIWRAKVSHEGEPFLLEKRSKKLAALIIERLQDERILR